MEGLTYIQTDERSLRIALAAAFRISARYDWQEATANHYSLAVSADGKQFLMNAQWRPFSKITASELVLLDSTAAAPPAAPKVDATAWCIHGAIHATVPQARCVLHVHPPYATALACLKDPRILAVDQTSARFVTRIAVDTSFGGMADNWEEGSRLAAVLGNRQILMMGNHGVITTGTTVAEAFDLMYHVERAARTLMLAYASGQPLNVMDDALAEYTAKAWEDGGAFGRSFFSDMQAMVDEQEPEYRS
jgi:ribulose-5-phosphate 4-epimerase/fuculose-1-phosphate aldolase